MSVITPNKALTEPTIGDTGWGTTINTNLTILDTAFGGSTTLTVTGASGTVTLSAAQYQSLYFIVTGTLTANVTYSLPSGVGGQWVVYNGSSGSFTVTFASAGGGTSYAVPQGVRTLIVSDGTNVSLSISNIGTVSGTVGVSNGGTGQTSLSSQSVLIGNGTSGVLAVAPSTANNVLTSNGISWSSASLASQFVSATGATGSITMPGGVIMKWGSGGAPSGSGSVSFSSSFPNACNNVQITINNGSGPITVNPMVVGTLSTTGFTVFGDATQSNGFLWFAVGY
jgi:hypothetical protein